MSKTHVSEIGWPAITKRRRRRRRRPIHRPVSRSAHAYKSIKSIDASARERVIFVCVCCVGKMCDIGALIRLCREPGLGAVERSGALLCARINTDCRVNESTSAYRCNIIIIIGRVGVHSSAACVCVFFGNYIPCANAGKRWRLSDLVCL